VGKQQAEVADECLGLVLLEFAQETNDGLGEAAAHLGHGRPSGVGQRDDDPAPVPLVVVPLD
jgi:hypothetical protein